MSGRRRPIASLGAICALLAVAGACATLGGANYVSIEDEWQLGRQLEADLAQRLPIVRDAALNRYVNDLGQRMIRQMPRKAPETAPYLRTAWMK